MPLGSVQARMVEEGRGLWVQNRVNPYVNNLSIVSLMMHYDGDECERWLQGESERGSEVTVDVKPSQAARLCLN